MDNFMKALSDMAVAYGGKVIVALVVMLAGWIFAGWIGSITRKALARAKIDETLSKFISRSALGHVSADNTRLLECVRC